MSLLCLASASPRRISLLQGAGVPHSVWPVDIDETPEIGEAPDALVRRLSQQKADAAAVHVGPDAPVLGADTIVFAGGAILGKPAHEGAARQMLQILSGGAHDVLTGYHLRYRGPGGELMRVTRVLRTEVEVRPLSEREVDGYLRSDEWRGKAGAYGLQGRFGTFVRGVRGSIDSVIGLPLCQVIEDLLAAGLLPPEWPTWAP